MTWLTVNGDQMETEAQARDEFSVDANRPILYLGKSVRGGMFVFEMVDAVDDNAPNKAVSIRSREILHHAGQRE